MNGPGRHIWLTVEGQPTKTWARGRFRLVKIPGGWMVESYEKPMLWPDGQRILFKSDEDAALFTEAAGRSK